MNEGIREALERPFEAHEIKWKPQTVKGDKAMVIAFVDARAIMDRLDEVLGVGGWQDQYTTLPDGSAVCKLRCRIGDEWVEKMDVGSESEQPDKGDRVKASFSDALKRTAVKFGIGRYLYRLPKQFVPYDTQRRQLVKTPSLPAWALPAKKGSEPTVEGELLTEEEVTDLVQFAGERGFSRANIVKATGKGPEFLTKAEGKSLWERLKKVPARGPEVAK